MLTKAQIKQHVQTAVRNYLLERDLEDIVAECKTPDDTFSPTGGHCAYVSVAGFRVYKTLGLDVELVAALGERKEGRAKEHVLIHSVIQVGDYQIDMCEGYSDKNILDGWMNHWNQTYCTTLTQYAWHETFPDEKGFWKECRYRGSPKDEEIIRKYIAEIWGKIYRNAEDELLPLIKCLREEV
jgi:hypothetical protein